jgi:Adenosine deaminase
VELEEIAAQLGITDRHLRRLFVGEFGLPPVAFAQTARCCSPSSCCRRQSLTTTEIAFSAGFGSLRRFHALFRSRYGLTPSAIRGKQADGAALDTSDCVSATGRRLPGKSCSIFWLRG